MRFSDQKLVSFDLTDQSFTRIGYRLQRIAVEPNHILLW